MSLEDFGGTVIVVMGVVVVLLIGFTIFDMGHKRGVIEGKVLRKIEANCEPVLNRKEYSECINLIREAK